MRVTRLAAILAAVALLVSAALASSASAASRTVVTVNPTALPTLLAVGVAPVAPGNLTVGDVVQASFPINGNLSGNRKVITHRGGLSFVPLGGGTLQITNFNIDLKRSQLTAVTVLNGDELPFRVPVFDIGATQSIAGEPACAGVHAGLTLTAAAAGALGAPGAAGAPIGNACVGG